MAGRDGTERSGKSVSVDGLGGRGWRQCKETTQREADNEDIADHRFSCSSQRLIDILSFLISSTNSARSRILRLLPMLNRVQYSGSIYQQILSGQKVTVVRCEEINCSGSFFRNKLKYHDYLNSEWRLSSSSFLEAVIGVTRGSAGIVGA